MNTEQKQRAQLAIAAWDAAGYANAANVGEMVKLLQEMVDADAKFKANVIAAVNAAAPDARHVEVDGQPVFVSRSGDDITDSHTLTPCPHCGGSGAAEDCAPQPPALTDERILEIAMSDDVSLVEYQGPGVRPRITVHNSIGGVYAFARAIERELLGENE